MKEHPIPQDITNYRFHIVGSMTLKQFLEIGAGIVFAAILYKTGLPAFIKYPIMFVSAILGAAAAFLPIEERPLDHWISTYIRVLYKPTQFFWKREPKIPALFSFSPNTSNQNTDIEIDLTPIKRERIREYMASLHQPNTNNDQYDAAQQDRVSAIVASFSDVEPTHTPVIKNIVEKPDLQPRIRVLRKPEIQSTDQTIVSTQETIVPILRPIPQAPSEPILQDTLPDVHYAAGAATQLRPEQVAQSIRVTETPLVQFAEEKNEEVSEKHLETKLFSKDELTQMLQPTPITKNDVVSAQGAATFNTNLPFPNIPSEPNKLVGMVLTQNGELIPGAVVEVRNSQGSIERAVKSNALGQFFITTPLAAGNYVVKVEAENFVFPTVSLIVNNSILQPLELRATT